MSQADFKRCWETVARDIRGLERNPAGPAAIAFHKAVKAGADPNKITAGFIGYRQFCEVSDKDYEWRCSAAKFISEESWPQYLCQREAKEYLARPRLEVVK